MNTLSVNTKIGYYIELRKKLDGVLLITGSLSLYIYGLIKIEDVGNDVDFVLINASEGDKEYLDSFAKDKSEDFSNTDNDEADGGIGLTWQYKTEEFSVDIFSQKYDNRIFELQTIHGLLRLSPIMATLKAKKIMNRDKDWEMIGKISALLFSKADIVEQSINGLAFI